MNLKCDHLTEFLAHSRHDVSYGVKFVIRTLVIRTDEFAVHTEKIWCVYRGPAEI